MRYAGSPHAHFTQQGTLGGKEETQPEYKMKNDIEWNNAEMNPPEIDMRDRIIFVYPQIPSISSYFSFYRRVNGL